jgi:putative hemolysin
MPEKVADCLSRTKHEFFPKVKKISRLSNCRRNKGCQVRNNQHNGQSTIAKALAIRFTRPFMCVTSISQAPVLALPSDSDGRSVAGARYTVRIAATAKEVVSALRLRHQVFNVEMGSGAAGNGRADLEFDAFDLRCRHLIVVSRETGETVGTYRLNDIETAGSADGFYSASEFTVKDLPAAVLQNGVEIGRACIAREHRNTKVLFLLWKGLLDYLRSNGKRYFFGCCSMFTLDEGAGAAAYFQLRDQGYLHPQFRVSPLAKPVDLTKSDGSHVDLPSLFNMYLRIGARVCGPPIMDEAFGSIDFFVLFDVEAMTDKYHRMFA